MSHYLLVYAADGKLHRLTTHHRLIVREEHGEYHHWWVVNARTEREQFNLQPEYGTRAEAERCARALAVRLNAQARIR